jgi:hypothetical protein
VWEHALWHFTAKECLDLRCKDPVAHAGPFEFVRWQILGKIITELGLAYGAKLLII